MIDIGKLDKVIIIETATDTRDDQGGYTAGWATFATVRANVRYPNTERESGEADRDTATIKAEFKVRWLSGVTPKMRISYDSVYFDITAVLHGSGRKEYIILRAEQKV